MGTAKYFPSWKIFCMSRAARSGPLPGALPSTTATGCSGFDCVVAALASAAHIASKATQSNAYTPTVVIPARGGDPGAVSGFALDSRLRGNDVLEAHMFTL